MPDEMVMINSLLNTVSILHSISATLYKQVCQLAEKADISYRRMHCLRQKKKNLYKQLISLNDPLEINDSNNGKLSGAWLCTCGYCNLRRLPQRESIKWDQVKKWSLWWCTQLKAGLARFSCDRTLWWLTCNHRCRLSLAWLWVVVTW